MLINKKLLITNGSSKANYNVKINIYILLFIYFYNNRFLNKEEWLFIVQKYQEDSIHLDRIKKCHGLIVNLYKSFKLKRTSIISNSLIFYHKYYIFNFFTNSQIYNNLDNNIDLKYISVACFFISLKTSNILMKIEYIIDFICENKILEIKDNNEKIKIKDMILNYENDIIFTINFEFEHELPYSCIKNLWLDLANKIIEYINNNKNNNKINNINNNILNNDQNASLLKTIKENIAEIINYSFLFPFFLYYNSSNIALSCLNIAFKKLNIKINIIDIISNHKEMEIISIDDIEVCSSLIDKIILSNIIKVNSDEQINNINNINMHNLKIINNNKEANNESKLKIKEESKKSKIVLQENQK